MTGPNEADKAVRPPAIKICGLTRREDAELAAGAGADYLGVVLVPGTPRALSPEAARKVLAGLAPSTVAGVTPTAAAGSTPSTAAGFAPSTVAVVADFSLERAVAEARLVGAGIVQLHGVESPRFAGDLKGLGPWSVWKAIRVKGVEDVLRGIEAYGDVVDGILLDGWHPRHRGGSGTPFSWEEVARVRECFPDGLRLIAAGGLTPENVKEAVHRLAPDVVDVSSGVEERTGIKRPEKVRAFVRNARRAH